MGSSKGWITTTEDLETRNPLKKVYFIQTQSGDVIAEIEPWYHKQY